MKAQKLWIPICLAVVLIAVCLFALPTQANAATSGYYTYLVYGGKATITDCNTAISGDVTIPSTLGGYPVTSIGAWAFAYCDSMTSVTIGNSVESIGNSAFSNCTSLTGITIPDSVTSIGGGAFSGCSGLQSITIPFVGGSRKTASDSYQYPFGYIFGTSSYTGGVKTVQYYYGPSTSSTTSSTYYIPSNLKSVTVTGGMILCGAFRNCTSLTGITIPDSVTSIGDDAFEDCTSLTSVTISNSVTIIGYEAFRGCTSLTSITIPDSVTRIGGWAFFNCASLTDVYITDPNAWCKISFEDSYSNPMSNGARMHILDSAGNEVTEVVLDSTVTVIPYCAFRGCTSLTGITIPDSVQSIGDGAFRNCTSLTGITIPDSVTSIGDGAFRNCTSLISASIGNSVTSIGDSAFLDCTSLTSVTIGNGVTSIGDQAFWNCTKLKNVYYPGTVSQWNAISIGYNNSNLTGATIHYNHVHNYEILDPIVVPATCTEDGYTEYTCIYGDTYRVTIPALGHTTGASAVVTAPTCTEEGYTTTQCTRCGEAAQAEFVPALGHDYTRTVKVVPPTCTEQGYTETQCVRCTSTQKSNYQDPLGHNAVVVPAKDPTCTEAGNKVGTQCQRCETYFIVPESIPSLGGHSFTEYVSNNDGTETAKCDRCEETDTRSERTVGDLDGNEEVTSDDVIALLLHISMPDLFPIDAEADFTGDGEVTSDDVIRLLLHISMPDLFPLS